MEPSRESRIISKRDLPAECDSRAATLDFSHTARGPNCTGCYNMVFETTCGHAYCFRKRCQPKGLVCTGSEILTVPVDDTILNLKGTGCGFCRKEQRNSKALMKYISSRGSTPKEFMSAKMRADAVKEVWQRKCSQSVDNTRGMNLSQLDTLAEEKRLSSQRSHKDTQASLPSPLNLGERPRLLHEHSLEREWEERARLILQDLESISPAGKYDEHPDSPLDPSPAFVFRSPFLRETFDKSLDDEK